MANESEQRIIICNNLRLILSDEVQTVFRLSPSLFSHAPYGARQLPPGGSQGGPLRIRPIPCCPPLGEVPHSGKGGVVGIFELFPFNEPHPLSQPCRFRSAVKSASSPIGEPRWLLRIRPSLYKNIGACRNPSVSPFGLPAPLSGALLVCVSNLP